MQPSNEKGKKTRAVLMPISWAVAFLTVCLILILISKFSGLKIRGMLRTDSFWPVVVLLPGFFLGKVLGLMAVNIISNWTPNLRRTFEEEAALTGRHDFRRAMQGLIKAAIILAIITMIGSFAFINHL